ncbi:hypothetical protein HanPSC8_Chr05g0204951 [Helianthus annuus]|nr:hypothetical protein HanLR1_Chr05g0177391 [Helianthus annuus]KAJ0922534.1 hypothetical protein HanPSC8_Chr05g0204951 [Helianthus annuus]
MNMLQQFSFMILFFLFSVSDFCYHHYLQSLYEWKHSKSEGHDDYGLLMSQQDR